LAIFYRSEAPRLAAGEEALGRCFAGLMGMALAEQAKAREIDQFVRGAAHDLRGSIARAGSLAGMLATQATLSPEAREMAGLVASNLNTLDPLLKELAAYVSAGEAQGPLAPVAISEAVEDARYVLRRRLEERQATLAYEGGREQVRARQRDLANVMERLIDNSLKFTVVKPHIRVAPEDTGAGIRVAVQDNGPGIAGEYAEQVFEPFRRLHGKQYPGHGLGLTICRKLVEASGGRIWVDTELSNGATIKMWFPKA
jgi:signal transduction histidine kinase